MNQPVDTAPVIAADIDMAWTEREALLQRLGVELSNLYSGSDAVLNGILDQLRAELSNSANTAELTQVADQLFKHLRTFELAAPSSQTNYMRIAMVLQDLFEELQVPVANFNDAQRLTEAAGKARTLEEVVTVLHCGIALLKDVNQFVDGKPSSASEADVAKPPVVERRSRKPFWLKSIARSNKDQPSAEEIFDALRPLLDRVLDKVASLDGVSKQVVLIKAELPNIKQPSEMHKVLEQVLELLAGIASGISKERKDTERFLGQLREKLQGIEQGIVSNNDDQSLERAEHLHADIGGEVKGIQEAVQEEISVDQMRVLIEQRVEKIGGTLDSYLSNERERHAESEKQVKDLTRKLREMEIESQQLRAKVQEKQIAVTRDALTGATNRFGYDERIVEEMDRSRRIGFPLSLVVVDVDRFKSVNDTYGHKAGDMVLQKVVEVMQSNVRKTDCIARYGGDEFVLILPDTPAEGAMNVAEKLRKGVENCGFHNNGEPVRITLCCGVTQVKADDSPETVFERADAAMYEVKRSKRNGSKMAK